MQKWGKHSPHSPIIHLWLSTNRQWSSIDRQWYSIDGHCLFIERQLPVYIYRFKETIYIMSLPVNRWSLPVCRSWVSNYRLTVVPVYMDNPSQSVDGRWRSVTFHKWSLLKSLSLRFSAMWNVNRYFSLIKLHDRYLSVCVHKYHSKPCMSPCLPCCQWALNVASVQ